jgi:hypothetical protein
VIVGIKKGSGITGAMRYVKGEGRDDVTGELKQRIGDNSRAELLGGQGLGFEITSEADAELARRVMEFAGKPENQASRAAIPRPAVWLAYPPACRRHDLPGRAVQNATQKSLPLSTRLAARRAARLPADATAHHLRLS